MMKYQNNVFAYYTITIFLSVQIFSEGKLMINDKFMSNILQTNASDFKNLLLSIFEKYIHPFKCIVVAVNNFYYDVLQSNFYNKFQEVAMITIKLEEYEDFSVPCNDTVINLEMAKITGCQFYLILSSDGLQVSNLLKYGDKNRIINTRANFVLLYNNKLFSEEMNYIWKRIVNVAFIREYGGKNKSQSKRKTTPWFEITTVPFPSPIGNSFVPRRLDIWRDGKFRSGADLFRDKTANLNKQTLRVVAFDHMPSVVKIPLNNQTGESSKNAAISNSNNTFIYTGIEIEVYNISITHSVCYLKSYMLKILEIISKAMNFNPYLYEPTDADEIKWGKKESNESYTGLLEEMVSSRADIALGDLHYSYYFLDVMDLSVPYNTECLTFITPESLTNNSWQTLILPFTAPLWIAILLCLLSIGFVFYFLSRFYYKTSRRKLENSKRNRKLFKNVFQDRLKSNFKLNVNEKYALMKKQYYVEKEKDEPIGLYLFGDISNSILYTYGMLLLVSLPKLPSGWSIRILTGWYWLYCILVIVAYRASMTAILAKPAPRVTIDTLRELVDSRLPIGGWGEMNRKFFTTSIDPLIKHVGEQFEIVDNLEETVDKITKGKFAFYENVHFLKQISVKHQLSSYIDKNKEENKTGLNLLFHNKSLNEENNHKHNLHIMSDCIIHMPISVGLQKNSPIKPNVDKYVKRTFEAGLIKKWLDDVMAPYLTAEINFQDKGDVRALMNLEKFFGAVVVLFIGYFISIIIFVTEVVYFSFVVRNKSDYNEFLKIIKKDKQ